METAAELIPEGADLAELRDIAAGCTACHLHELGTQTVFGEGPRDARLVIVGEQPGDEEDREGEPFVGPAGRELDRALDAVGIDRDETYITNVVKHFKWSEKRGKRRIHETPNSLEIDACFPWLRAEITALDADVILALGRTAAQAVVASDFKVTQDGGRFSLGPERRLATATAHPSSILRRRTDEERHAAREEFHRDLERVAVLLHEGVASALALGTKDELYELAQDLDVDGRSTMDKDALVAAVAAALER